LQLYSLKPSTSNCQVKYDSVEKLYNTIQYSFNSFVDRPLRRWSYILFNKTACRFFSIQKCSKCYLIFKNWLHVTANNVTVTFW